MRHSSAPGDALIGSGKAVPVRPGRGKVKRRGRSEAPET